MKIALKILLVTLSLVLLLTLISCDGKDPGTEDGEAETIDRTVPSAGKYKIRFFLGPNYIIHYYNEGETIVPPTTLPTCETPRLNYIFESWDGVEFKTVTGDAVYKAKYKEVYNYYTVTYVVGDEKKEVETICGDYPRVPAISEFQIADGSQFVKWDQESSVFNEDVTITAIMTKCFDPSYFLAAFNTGLLIYPKNVYSGDNSTTAKALALNILMIEENQNPQGGAVADRIVEHLIACVQADQAPAFDASCNWNYAPHTGAIALAKATPTVWNKIPADIKNRLNTMMKAFAILESFATSDQNNYSTGPGMKGNYNKDWNPNYRLANIPVMVYVTHYFGDGDMEKGAVEVNTFLKDFDEEAYTDIIGLFQKYGWRRARLTWSADARTSSDGKTQGKDAKTLLIYGGQAVGEDTSTASNRLVALGTGVGVGNGGEDYLYKGYKLSEPEGIIRSLLMNNYGGGKDFTKSNQKEAYFLEVKSNHMYDKDKDGDKEVVAWILDGSNSPYEGQFGMMREFASGNRSSTSYCSHDFVLTTTLIYNTKILGIYDITQDDFKDYKGHSLREAIVVGNEDFLYKNEIGYHGYATGSYGESDKEHSEKNENSSYFALKSLWRLVMKPEIESTFAE